MNLRAKEDRMHGCIFPVTNTDIKSRQKVVITDPGKQYLRYFCRDKSEYHPKDVLELGKKTSGYECKKGMTGYVVRSFNHCKDSRILHIVYLPMSGGGKYVLMRDLGIKRI